MRWKLGETVVLLWTLGMLLTGSTSIFALAPADRFELRPESVAFPSLPAALLPGEAPKANLPEPGPRESLLRTAGRFGEATYIPYVWGGDAIGDKATCEACRACVSGKHRLAVERRAGACSACRQCGVDCSHFVNRLFREAGMPYPYLSTSSLRRLSADRLKREYSLIDLGKDLRRALPGDLLVTKHHVVLLLGMRQGSIGDFIHVSRSIKAGRIGGVEIVRDKDVERYRGRLVRILRHQALGGDSDQGRLPAPLHVTPPSALDGQRFVWLTP